MRAITQTREYQTGINTELKLQRWLMANGYMTVRVGHGGDVAPLLHGWSKSLRLPDLQIVLPKLGRMVWGECKWKQTAPMYRVRDCRTTGVDAKAFRDYQDVERITGHAVYLFFVHQDENEVRLATLERERGWFRGSGVGGEMMFVPYDGLPKITTYHDLMSARAMPATIDTPLFVPKDEDHWIQKPLDLIA